MNNMEDNLHVKGWVFKQSRFLKRWQKEWMVLSGDILATFKADEESSFITKISVSDIKSVETCNKNGFSAFKVCTSKQEMIFFTEQADNWVKTIYQQLKDSMDWNSMAKSESAIRSVFARFLEVLNEREKEISIANDKLFGVSREKAKDQLDKIEETQAHCEGEYKGFKQIVESERKISAMSTVKSLPQKKTEDNFNLPEVALMMNPTTLKNCIVKNVKLSCVNPYEVSVTRSQITRALKWRYSGDKTDALSFSVTHDVVLTGIGICRPYRPGGQLLVQKFTILNGRSADSRPVYTHKKPVTVNHCVESSVFKINLGSPFLLKKGLMYTASFIIEGTPSYKCVDCQSECSVGEISWEFFNTCLLYTSDAADE